MLTMIGSKAFKGYTGTVIEITASDRNRFRRVVRKIRESGANDLAFGFVEAE